LIAEYMDLGGSHICQ